MEGIEPGSCHPLSGSEMRRQQFSIEATLLYKSFSKRLYSFSILAKFRNYLCVVLGGGVWGGGAANIVMHL